MATENPLWGEERIANELLLKLGLRVSPRTVRKYNEAIAGSPARRSALVDLSSEPRQGNYRVRLPRGGHGNVPTILRLGVD
jgi:hypothetical protein